MTQESTPSFMVGRWRAVLFLFVLLGVVALSVGAVTAPARAWRNLLLHNFYFLAIAVMAAAFVAIQYVAKAGWPTLLRRVPEAMAGYVPAGALLMLAFALLGHGVYHWAHAGEIAADPVLQAKSPYLNLSGYAVRTVLVLAAWLALTWLLVRKRRRREGAALVSANAGRGALFLVAFVLTFSVASIDWIQSLEPHWASTLFPWYVMSSAFVACVALIALFVMLLQRKGHLREVNGNHLHDLGKYVFAFSVFWGYLWFSQYMLIWYANIPEETSYYVRRGQGWSSLFWVNLVVNLFVPLLLLLPAAHKRSRRWLASICLVVVAGHWLDIYLLVMPSQTHAGPLLGWMEALVGLGVASLFFLVVNRALKRAPLLPREDPLFEESLHHHHA